jgi:hypothetical protein
MGHERLQCETQLSPREIAKISPARDRAHDLGGDAAAEPAVRVAFPEHRRIVCGAAQLPGVDFSAGVSSMPAAGRSQTKASVPGTP